MEAVSFEAHGGWTDRLLDAERRALEQTAAGAPFEAVLQGLVRSIEEAGAGMLASILLLDRDGRHLRNGAASPGLPADVVARTEGLPVGPGAASCGTAIFRHQRVVVRDIESDPLWADYRRYVLPHGLRACWSTPIANARGQLLGTFAIYYREAREPPLSHVRIVGQLERTVSVILERQRAEQERARLVADLEAANARQQSLFDGTAEAILVIAADGRYLDANRAATQLTGYSLPELTRMRVGDLAVDAEAARDGWPALAREGVWSGETELLRKDGSRLAVDARLSPVRLASDVVHVSTMRDISERKALERLRRDFLAVVGHELRNPLNSIMGSAEVMRATGAYSQKAIERIVRQTRQLERIVADLQEAQDIESGHLRLRLERQDLLPLLRSCVEEAAAVTTTHAVRIEAEGGPLEGNWDGDRICQVLRNLLSNAIKYSPGGGEVVVRVLCSNEALRVSITDRGPGIAKEMLPRLFQRYSRLPDTAEAVPGMGVGLFVCKELIEGHGGSLTVTSEIGQGSTFTFELPARGSVG